MSKINDFSIVTPVPLKGLGVKKKWLIQCIRIKKINTNLHKVIILIIIDEHFNYKIS